MGEKSSIKNLKESHIKYRGFLHALVIEGKIRVGYSTTAVSPEGKITVKFEFKFWEGVKPFMKLPDDFETSEIEVIKNVCLDFLESLDSSSLNGHFD